jgi:hypothetical protein
MHLNVVYCEYIYFWTERTLHSALALIWLVRAEPILNHICGFKVITDVLFSNRQASRLFLPPPCNLNFQWVKFFFLFKTQKLYDPI